jgi:putative two-component system response regulator
MEKNNLPSKPSDADQLKKYADDLVKVCQSEKQKRKELQVANKQLVKFADDLNKTVKELQGAYLDTINRLVLAAEYKDEDTGDHIVRMSRYSAFIAEKLGLPARKVQNIRYAAPMHDVGKIGIPDNILMKPGKLTDEEFDFMKTHSIIGATILADSKADILQLAWQIAVSHHEKWNGRGYPQGFSGDKIPIAGRIVGLADVFDALTSKRPYKVPYPVEVACDIIKKERGQHFDPELVDIFMENIDEFEKIKAEVGTAEDVSLADFIRSERDLAGEGT